MRIHPINPYRETRVLLLRKAYAAVPAATAVTRAPVHIATPVSALPDSFPLSLSIIPPVLPVEAMTASSKYRLDRPGVRRDRYFVWAINVTTTSCHSPCFNWSSLQIV